ncbi:hypothetical protein [Paenibacillus sp. MMS18-CY102]|uniref:hypothetical protein n=1 Tax=Paenibacillus sp. MMS18-CY102 TaxID=2682849 RepID=UPI00136519A0|nr:hypothetical protein [Paenibacillus sp. MMS18-CY102]MWC31045.1 hypothetical protein [Paenibacillus sp. MMS18-CY102]
MKQADVKKAGAAAPVKKQNIAGELSKLNKEELVSLLAGLANEIKEVEQALALKFADGDSEEGMQQYKKIIRASIKKYAERHGFVTYRNVPYAVGGAEKVLQKADGMAEKGNSLRAVEISLCVMHEMGELLQACDDSGGIVGGIIQECLALISQAVSQLANMPSKDQATIYQLLLKEAGDPSLEDWSDWQLSLLETAALLICTTEERQRWSFLIDQLEAEERGSSAYSNYFTEQAAELRYQVILKFDGGDAAQQYLRSNLAYTVFRQMAIEYAIENEQYEEALYLAEQGEKQDTMKRLPGLVNKWRGYRYDIYGLTHQLDLQIALAEQFVLSGEYGYYIRLKQLYDGDKWAQACNKLLNQLESESRGWVTDSLYTRVLVEENETERLMAYVRQSKGSIKDYYMYLLDDYAEEVYQLFTTLITEETAHSTNRKQYQKVCGVIRLLVKAGGGVHARKLIEQLQLAYPNRSALMDELEKVQLS